MLHVRNQTKGVREDLRLVETQRQLLFVRGGFFEALFTLFAAEG